MNKKAMKNFRRLSDHKPVDLVPYITKKLKERKIDDVEIYIGTDSQRVSNTVTYATVIALHYGMNGCHVLYSKKVVHDYKNNTTLGKEIKSYIKGEDVNTNLTALRLWQEVEDSLEAAMYLEAAGLPRVKYIDLDLNPDPVFRSNMVLRAACGYIESMGFTPRIKPNAPMASTVADHVLH